MLLQEASPTRLILFVCIGVIKGSEVVSVEVEYSHYELFVWECANQRCKILINVTL